MQGDNYQIDNEPLINFPLKTTKDKDILNNIVSIVNSLSTSENTNIILEKEIDQLVYKLYELTDDEIKIIEDSIK